jgi:hypothetical protein
MEEQTFSGVIVFMITSVRYRPVHDNVYMQVYKALEERNMPLGFHAVFIWQGDRSFEQLNKLVMVQNFHDLTVTPMDENGTCVEEHEK